MERIIDGVLYEGKIVPDAWDVRIWEANGHREVSARQQVVFEEVGPAPAHMLNVADSWAVYIGAADSPQERDIRIAMYHAEREEKDLKNRRRAAQRAKTACRRIIKAEGFDELLTLTYRENQRDRELCKKHFKEWVRRMKRSLGDAFRYCASFERQERGSMHVHLATHKLPKMAMYKGVKIKAWELGTKVWRSIVGDNNGLCFVGGRTKNGGYRRNMSIGKMAAYVSKYILKDFEDAPLESNRYSRSNGLVIQKSKLLRFAGVGTVWDVLELAFECTDGHVIVSHSVDADRGSYWLVTEPDKGASHATIH
ncbi:hypothetical protein ACFX58_16695 [Sphingomonas sp. NCPPB 2930]